MANDSSTAMVVFNEGHQIANNKRIDSTFQFWCHTIVILRTKYFLQSLIHQRAIDLILSWFRFFCSYFLCFSVCPVTFCSGNDDSFFVAPVLFASHDARW
jgi:hypothetical protein